MPETPRYTLIYFDTRGRAEPIRLLLAHAGVPFEDRGIQRDTWPSLKPEMPLGQLPVLVEHSADGDVVIPQSAAILRHLARRHGLYGANERESLQADVACDTALDLRTQASALRHSPRWQEPAEKAKYAETVAPVHLARLEKLLGDREWFAAKTPTFADFLAFDALESHLATWPSILEKTPRLSAFVERVRRLQSLQIYLTHRRPAA